MYMNKYFLTIVGMIISQSILNAGCKLDAIYSIQFNSCPADMPKERKNFVFFSFQNSSNLNFQSDFLFSHFISLSDVIMLQRKIYISAIRKKNAHLSTI